MPERSRPPFRADHIGSLLRTPELLQAKADLQDGNISKEDLVRLENEDIKSVIALQKRLAYKVITDGEYRRKVREHKESHSICYILIEPHATAVLLRRIL